MQFSSFNTLPLQFEIVSFSLLYYLKKSIKADTFCFNKLLYEKRKMMDEEARKRKERKTREREKEK